MKEEKTVTTGEFIGTLFDCGLGLCSGYTAYKYVRYFAGHMIARKVIKHAIYETGAGAISVVAAITVGSFIAGYSEGFRRRASDAFKGAQNRFSDMETKESSPKKKKAVIRPFTRSESKSEMMDDPDISEYIRHNTAPDPAEMEHPEDDIPEMDETEDEEYEDYEEECDNWEWELDENGELVGHPMEYDRENAYNEDDNDPCGYDKEEYEEMVQRGIAETIVMVGKRKAMKAMHDIRRQIQQNGFICVKEFYELCNKRYNGNLPDWIIDRNKVSLIDISDVGRNVFLLSMPIPTQPRPGSGGSNEKE